MNRHDRQAHNDLIATARGMYPQNVPVRPTRKTSLTRRVVNVACAAIVIATWTGIAAAAISGFMTP